MIMVIIIMNRFVDREAELRAINEKLMSEKFELIVIYGRRRVGKTDSFLRQLRKYHTFTIWRG